MLYPGSSVSEGLGGALAWLMMAAIGGAMGGVMGHFAPRWPLALVPLVAMAVFRMTELRSWETWLGIMRNLLCIAIVLSVGAFWTKRGVSWIREVRLGQGRHETPE